MFLEFYGLREQPFGVTPDPRFLYLGKGHREALASLIYGIESGRGFSALTAEPGMGKTSLLLRLLQSLQGSARTAFVFQTEGNSRDFLRAILHDLGIVPRDKSLAATHEALNESLLQELTSGRRVVLVIDEAQNLTEKTLESVRLLSNFETPAAKLMHIVLSGQPKLDAKLAQPSLMQLRQRVSSIIQIKPFQLQEVIDYIEHRHHTAGLKGQIPFTPDALAQIARSSGGIPRNINNICFQALSLGFATQSKTVGAEIVREVLADLEIESGSEARKRVSDGSASRQVSAQWPTMARLPEKYETGYPSYPTDGGTRFVSRFAMVAALFAIPFLVGFFLSANKAAGTNLPSEFAAVLFGASTENSDVAPVLPRKLNPPIAPTIEKAPAASPAESPQEGSEATTDGGVAPDRENEHAVFEAPPGTRVVHLKRAQTTFEVSREYLGHSDWKTVDEVRALNPSIRSAYETLPRGTAVALPEGAHGDPRTLTTSSTQQAGQDSSASAGVRFSGASTMVRVQRKETIFQFALDQYGKSSWDIVREICQLNPQLRSPYQLLQQGQYVRAPQLVQDN